MADSSSDEEDYAPGANRKNQYYNNSDEDSDNSDYGRRNEEDSESDNS